MPVFLKGKTKEKQRKKEKYSTIIEISSSNLGGLIGAYGFHARSRIGVRIPSWIGVADGESQIRDK